MGPFTSQTLKDRLICYQLFKRSKQIRFVERIIFVTILLIECFFFAFSLARNDDSHSPYLMRWFNNILVVNSCLVVIQKWNFSWCLLIKIVNWKKKTKKSEYVWYQPATHANIQRVCSFVVVFFLQLHMIHMSQWPLVVVK